MSQRFSGRRAIITGGASGVGLAVARRMTEEGGKVSLWDMNAERLKRAQQDIGAAHICVIDVTDAEAVSAAMKDTAKALGGIDILVTCAGIVGPVASIAEFPLADWRRVLSVNLDGTFHCCRSAIPHMQSHGYGRVVMLSSIVGKEGVPGASAYAASKAGVIGLTKVLGKELARSGIIVNAITPGPLRTPMIADLPPQDVEMMKNAMPLARLGEAEECAAMICFMASDECSFTTGAVFDLSGGSANY